LQNRKCKRQEAKSNYITKQCAVKETLTLNQH